MAAKKEKEKGIVVVDFADKMRENFIDYARKVIMDRALPDVYTGMKPVQQRILQSMLALGLLHDRPYKKSARVAGDVIGRLNPHGDTSAYEAMVVMAQPFKMMVPLVDMSGNVGSIDGDPAAAMRYTESRMSKIGEIMLEDLNKDTVDMVPNYDESEMEATVLPSKFANLIVNGSTGIAVGMACSFLPHNPKDVYKVLDKILKDMINDKETTIDDIIRILQAPDFPTGGVIVGNEGFLEGYRTGRGTVAVRGTYEIEEHKNKQVIVFTEIPYGTIKSRIVEKIGSLVRDKEISGISEVKDLSAKGKIRIEIWLKKDANVQYVLNKLFKHTDLKTTCHMIHVALVENRPVANLTIRDLFTYFLEHVFSVISRRIQFDKNELDKKLHILEALVKVLESDKNRKQTIKLIETEKTEKEAISKLKEAFEFDDEQAEYIVDQKIRSLNPERITKIREDYDNKVSKRDELQAMLEDDVLMLKQVRLELSEVADNFKKFERKTKIALDESTRDIDMRELIEEQDLVITLTNNGLVKALSLSDTSVQNRNGKGSNMKLKEDDFSKIIVTASTKDDLFIVTNEGKGYVLPVYKIPVVSKNATGKYMANYVPISSDEKIVSMLPITGSEDSDILFITKMAIGKRMKISDLPKTSKGARVISIKDNDELISASFVHENDSVFIATAEGFALKTPVSNVKFMGKAAAGTILMRFKTNSDHVVSAVNVSDDMKLLVVTRLGVGKRLEPELIGERKNRGGKGMMYYKPSDKTGEVVSVLPVDDSDTVFIGTQSNQVIRIRAIDIRETGRTGRGVQLIKLTDSDTIVSVAAAPEQSEDTSEGE